MIKQGKLHMTRRAWEAGPLWVVEFGWRDVACEGDGMAIEVCSRNWVVFMILCVDMLRLEDRV